MDQKQLPRLKIQSLAKLTAGDVVTFAIAKEIGKSSLTCTLNAVPSSGGPFILSFRLHPQERPLDIPVVLTSTHPSADGRILAEFSYTADASDKVLSSIQTFIAQEWARRRSGF